MWATVVAPGLPFLFISAWVCVHTYVASTHPYDSIILYRDLCTVMRVSECAICAPSPWFGTDP